MQPGNPNRMTVKEASLLLGISEAAVRKRLRRGSLRGEKGEGGRVYVVMEEPPVQDVDSTVTSDVSDLREEIRYLRERLVEADQRDRESRRLLAAAISRVPEIEAPGVETEGEPTPSRSWLSRFFFGPE